MVAVAEWLLFRTGFGRRFRAVGSSPLASYRLGIDSQRLTWIAFVISGLLTGIGGLMLAGQVGIGSPTTGSDYTLMSITVVVLGGASVTGGRGLHRHASGRGPGAGDVKRLILYRCQFLGALHRDRHADFDRGNLLQLGAATGGRGQPCVMPALVGIPMSVRRIWSPAGGTSRLCLPR